MARKAQVLSPQQQQLLTEARDAKIALDKAEAEIMVEVEAMLSRRLTPLKARLARAITQSITFGVPKARVNLEVLGVTTPTAYQRWTDMDQGFQSNPGLQAMTTPAPATTSAEPQFAEAAIHKAETLGSDAEPTWPLPAALRAHPHAGHFSFVGDPANRTISVTWGGYESTAADAPGTLSGVVQYDPSAATGWVAVSDPQDRSTPFGIETGALTFEAEQRRGDVPLRQALADYIAAADLPEFEVSGLDADEDVEEGF